MVEVTSSKLVVRICKKSLRVRKNVNEISELDIFNYLAGIIIDGRCKRKYTY